MRLPLVLDRGRGLDRVALQRHVADLLLQTDADLLLALGNRAGVADDVVLEHQSAGDAAHADPGRRLLHAVVLDHVLLEPVTVRRHAVALLPETDAVLVVAADTIVAEQVVGVLVADRDAVAAVVFKKVVFEQTVLYAPAEEQAVVAV